MTLTVSVSELRNNISEYLERVTKGARIVIRDEKKNKTIAEIAQTSSFDKQIYEKTLRKAAGVFTAKNHPEWKTESDIKRWITKHRLSDERKF